MDPNRLNRLVWVSVAGLSFVAVVTLLSRSAGPAAKPPEYHLDPNHAPPLLHGATPGFKPDPSRIGTSSEGVIKLVNPKTGRLERMFTYDTLTPHERGVFDVIKPQAWMYLAPFRVIGLRSDLGKFVAPANQPQSGEFHKNVVLTVYQSPRDRAALLTPDSPDRSIRIDMDDAEFDTTLGEITSKNRVVLTTPVTDQVRFEGKGMRLVYNDDDARIEYLEVTEGKSLHYHAKPPVAESATAPPGNPGNPGSPRSPNVGSPSAPAPPAAPPPPVGSPLAAHAPAQQYYRVTFERDVRVRSEDRTIDADQLVVYFTLEKSDTLTAPGSPRSANVGLAPTSLMQAALLKVVSAMPSLIAEVGTPELAAGHLPPAASAKTGLGDKDVVLTWGGRMVMTPVDARPSQLVGDQDVLLVFEGAPVKAGLGKDSRLVCRTLEYLDSHKQITATGSDAFPLRLTSPSLGRCAAPQLVMWMDKNAGELRGPGSIDSSQFDDSPQPAGRRAGLPPGFHVEWSRQVDLKFAKDSGASESRIQLVNFHGDVRVTDPQFGIQAQDLAAHFSKSAAKPATKGGADAQLSRIDASGNVLATHKDGRVQAQHLELDLTPGPEGKVAPHRLIARKNVNITDPQQQIASDFLDVIFAPPTAKPARATTLPSPPSPNFTADIQTALATGSVQLKLRGGTLIHSDKLLADGTTGRAELFGTPVRLTHASPDTTGRKPPLSELRVPHLTLEDHGKVAHAEGRGEYIYTEVDQPSAKNPAVVIPGKRVHVTWADRMTYADRTNLLQVFGHVVTESEDSPTELNRLTASSMALELLTPQPSKHATSPPSPGSGLERRDLRRMIARDNVVLLSTRWADPQHARVVTRLRLSGDNLTFANNTGTATVDGPGSMLVEDYRPETHTASAPKPANAAKPDPDGVARPVSVSGRGATLFTWTKNLTLDDSHGQMDIDGKVYMTHRPLGVDTTLELQSDHLRADVDTGRGIKALNTSGEQVNLKNLLATGHVQVRDRIGRPDERMITAHTLQYDGKQQSILLTAPKGRTVSVVQLNQPKPITAASILWRLKSDEFDVRDVNY